MSSDSDKTFVHTIDSESGAESYLVQFDFGTKKIQIKEGSKIDLDFVHGGFREVFSRKGNDLIIGDDTYCALMERLGVGYGKEVWNISKTEDLYSIRIDKYSWCGSTVGYSQTPHSSQTIEMNENELSEFMSKHNITLNEGINTLYTTWPIVPNPEIHYHMEDHGYYAPANGKIILVDYFLYGQNVSVNGVLLSDIIKNNPKYSSLITVYKDKKNNIIDTIFSDNIYGTDKADKIKSLAGDDRIEGKKGNDKITLGSGNKNIVINQKDGSDTIYNFQKADSVRFTFDTDNIEFEKSKNNLIIKREYEDGTEKTIINNYFKNYNKKNNIIISNGETVLVEDLTKGLTDGNEYLTLNTTSRKIKGSDFNDEAFSTSKNETFSLGKGNDIIHFRPKEGLYIVPYSFGNDIIKLTKDSHLVLDFDNSNGQISCERKGNDAVLTSKFRMELCGRDNGKEDWTVKKLKNGNYKITKTEYYFTGYEYKTNGSVTEEVWTKSDIENFKNETGISLKTGKNTLYTSWAVVANPIKHYSKKDSAYYGQIFGTITLKDYFKYNTDSVYVGDKSLREFFANKDELFAIDKSDSQTAQQIEDTTLAEIIKGSNFSDTITSNYENDRITPGKGNDTIYLGKGEKTLYINKGDGKDTISVLSENDSVKIVFDDIDSLNFRKSGNNLVINREYEGVEEHTVIRGYYKNDAINIKIFTENELLWDSTKDTTDLTWHNTSKYPPTNDIEKCDETVICPYLPDEDYVILGQDITAWQTDNNSSAEVAEYVQYNDYNITVVPS